MAGELMETWRPVAGYEGLYEVSDHGRVRSLPRMRLGRGGKPVRVNGRILKPALVRYPMVLLCNDGQRVGHSVHRLVANAFLPPDPVRPEVNHRDGNRQNNHLSNLEWVTRSENVAHSYVIHGSRKKVG